MDDDFIKKLMLPRKGDDDYFIGDNSSFNFRVNGNLKDEFVLLCKKEQLSASVILKRYMLQCVNKNEITL